MYIYLNMYVCILYMHRATRSSDMGCPVGPVMQVGGMPVGGSNELPSVGDNSNNRIHGSAGSAPDASSVASSVSAMHAPGGAGGGGVGAHRSRGESAGVGGKWGGGGGGGGEQAWMANNSVSVAAEKSAAPPSSNLFDKLSSCIKLGVLPAGVCLYIYTRARAHTRTHVHVHIHTHIHIYIHTQTTHII
jgi:hypothetical protein